MAVDKVFTVSDFQIGDIFCAFKYNDSGSKIYWDGVYQGDSKFLMFSTTSSNGRSTIDTTTVFSETIATDFALYYILRPSQAASYTGMRDISTGALTETEESWISAITPNLVTNKVWLLNDLAPKIYSYANIDISAYFGTNPMLLDGNGNPKPLTNYNMGETLFRWENGKRVVRPSNYNLYLSYCNKMLVEGYYGGTEFATSKTFTAADFQIGDLFVAYGPATDGSGNVYYTAVYQGDGVFLAADQTGSSKGGNYAYAQDTTTVFNENISTRFSMYYVLRPSNLAK